MIETKIARSARVAVAIVATCWITVGSNALADTPISVNVVAGDLADALDALAKQCGVDVIYASSQLKGRKTEGIRGVMEVRAAFERLLEGTPLILKEQGGSLLITLPDRSSALQDEPEVSLDTVIVTGTHIRGAAPAGSLVISIDREQIDRSGYSTAQQVLANLPQNFNGGVSESTSFVLRDDSETNIGLGSGVNLRGLGNDSTLVLVDGRRLAPSGYGGSFVDTSMIPLSAVARIDVLTDGASAIYGADAVGGVVNFVLRDDYDGAETGLRYGVATQGGAAELRFNQSLGRNWSSGHAGIAYEVYDRDRLAAADRAFSAPTTRPPTDLMPSQKRQALFAYGSQEIGARTKASANVYVAQRDAEISMFNPRAALPLANVLDILQYGGTAGLDIAASPSVDFDLSATYSEQRMDRDQFDLATNLTRASDRMRSQYWSFDATTNVDLMQLPGGRARFALGGHYRNESFDDPGRERRIGLAAPDFERNVRAIFGEVYLPIVSRVEVSAAIRHEEYSDVGSTTNPKLGMSWKPVDGLTIRGTIGTSFRAPQFTELDASAKQALFMSLPNPNDPSGETLSLVSVSAPAPELGPESADSWTLGFDLAPPALPGMNVQATYYSIDFKDRIVTPLSFVRAFTDPALAPLVTMNPSAEHVAEVLANLGYPLEDLSGGLDPRQAQAIVDIRTRNLASTKTQGVDLTLMYRRDAAMGELRLTGNANYILKFDDRFAATAPARKAYDIVYNPVGLRTRVGLSWTRSELNTSLFANYVDAYADDQVVPHGRVPSWTTWDAQIAYRFAGPDAFVNGWVVALNAHNLFDKDPPRVMDLSRQSGVNLGFDPQNAHPLGRVLSLDVRKQW